MTRSHVQGTIYLLHFDQPFKHARHYSGWTERDDVQERLAEHASGRGSKLMAAVVAAGITWRLAAVVLGDRYEERRLKNRGGASRRCPICREESRTVNDLNGGVSNGIQGQGTAPSRTGLDRQPAPQA
jgi:predicted GIY-YIG superfamily endonuclease